MNKMRKMRIVIEGDWTVYIGGTYIAVTNFKRGISTSIGLGSKRIHIYNMDTKETTDIDIETLEKLKDEKPSEKRALPLQ